MIAAISRPLVAALLMLLGRSAQATPLAHIDHIILGVPDLDQAMASFEQRTGVRPEVGGSHPGRGTRNALVSHGHGTYLELIAPDPAQAYPNDWFTDLRALAGPTPVGWAIAAPDLSALGARMARVGLAMTAPEPGSRRRPNGELLEWETASFTGLDGDDIPFVIRWKDPARHPSRTSPAGCTLTSFAIETPRSQALRRLSRAAGLSIAVLHAAKPRMRLALKCPRGPVIFD